MDFITAGSENANEGQRRVELVKEETLTKRQATPARLPTHAACLAMVTKELK
jgi:hypothetical protein